MKTSNKESIALFLDKIIQDEFLEMNAVNKTLNNKITEKDLKIKELEKEIRKSENIAYEYAKYKTFYHTHFGVCPQCKGQGGWEDGYGGGGECDVCMGKGEIEHDKIREFVLSEIKNTL